MIDALVKLLEKFKISFNMTPSTLVLILGLITSSVYFYMDNKKLKEQIPTLVDQNDELKKQVENLNGRIATYDRIMDAFIENPPAVLQNEINRLDDLISRHHDNIQPVSIPDSIIRIPTSLPDIIENN